MKEHGRDESPDLALGHRLNERLPEERRRRADGGDLVDGPDEEERLVRLEVVPEAREHRDEDRDGDHRDRQRAHPAHAAKRFARPHHLMAALLLGLLRGLLLLLGRSLELGEPLRPRIRQKVCEDLLTSTQLALLVDPEEVRVFTSLRDRSLQPRRVEHVLEETRFRLVRESVEHPHPCLIAVSTAMLHADDTSARRRARQL